MATYNNVITNVSGSVGIGTTNATSRLTLLGSTTNLSEPILTVRPGAAQATATAVFEAQDSSGNSIMHVSGSGVVRVGAWPLGSSTISTLNIYGSSNNNTGVSVGDVGGNRAFFVASWGTNGLPSIGTVSNSSFSIFTNVVERMRIDTLGNIGIGTNSYTARLLVSGSSTGTTPTLVVQHGVAQGSSLPVLDVRNSEGTSLLFVSGSGVVSLNGSAQYGNSKLQIINGDDQNGGQVISQMSLQYFGGGYSHHIQSLHNTAADDGNAIRFHLNTSSTAGGSTTVGTGNALAYAMGYSTHRWNTGGSERMRIDGSGNVGIGTTTAGARIHAYTAANSFIPGLFEQYQASPPASPIVKLVRPNNLTSPSTAGAGLFISDHSSNFVIHAEDHTANPLFTVRGNGNVGIGTTNTNGNRLAVNGDMSITGSILPFGDAARDLGSATYRWRTLFAANISGSLTPTGATAGSVFFAGSSGQIQQDNSNLFWDDTNNRLGIGTNTSLSYPLTVVGPSATTTVAYLKSPDTSGAALFFGDSSGILGQLYVTSTGTWLDYNTALSLRSGYGGTTRFLISSTGVVGVGTSTTAGNRIVLGGVASGTAYVKANEGAFQVGNIFAGPLSLLTADTERVLIDSNGNISLRQNSNASNTSVSLNTTVQNAMTLDSSGNLGVGRTSIAASATGQTIEASGCVITGGPLNAHQTSRGVFEYNTNIVAIRAYGATTGTGQIQLKTGGGGGNADLVAMTLDSSGHALPGADNARDLGSAGTRWRTLFAVNISGSLTPTGATAGSVFFAGGSGQINQDNANFFWDDTNNRLGIGTAAPDQLLDIRGNLSMGRRAQTSLTRYVGLTDTDGTFKNTSGGGTSGIVISQQSSGDTSIGLRTGRWGVSEDTRVTIDRDGNTGIGTTNPGRRLTISRDTESSSGQLELRTVGGISDGNFDGIYFTQGGTGAVALASMRVINATTGQPHIGFYTRFGGGSSETEKVRIQNGGNVGIGGTNPLSRLEVTGSTADNSASALHVINASNSSLLFVRNDSRVGIASSSPGYTLDVGGDINIANASRLRVGGVQVINAAGSGNDIYINSRVIRNESSVNTDGMYIGYANTGTTAGHLRFYANGTNERMRIWADTGSVFVSNTPGNISSAAARFLVSGSSTASTPTMIVREGVVSPTGGALTFEVENSAGATLFSVSGSGNVGVGTSNASGKFEVVGTSGSLMLVTDSLSGSLFSVNDVTGLPIFEVFSDDTVVAGAVNTNALVVTGSLVGIGTRTPTNTLMVSGTLRVTSVSNATGDFATYSATGVLQKRTASEVKTDIGLSNVQNLSVSQIFNNTGATHGTRNDFNGITDFGYQYVQGATNGPNLNSATQYYAWTIGLGSEYPYSQYAAQFALPRSVSNPYMGVRYREVPAGWGAWQKLAAGNADTLTTTRTIWGQNFDGSGNVSGNLTSVGNITGTGTIGINPAASGNVALNTSGTGATIIGNLYYLTSQSIALALGTDSWVRLATVANLCDLKLIVRINSTNTEECINIAIKGNYYNVNTKIDVDRVTYAERLREVYVDQPTVNGGNKTIYLRVRSSSASPTVTWYLYDSTVYPVTIHNDDMTGSPPSSGVSVILSTSVNTLQVTNSNLIVSGTNSPKIGIGISNPTTSLHVNGTTRLVDHVAVGPNLDPTVKLYVTSPDTSASNYSGLFTDNSGIQIAAFMNDKTVRFANNAVRIDGPTGNVGIGTTNTNGNKLAVNGDMSITGSILPFGDNARNLGSASYRWANIYGANIYPGSSAFTAGSVVFAGTSGVLAQNNSQFYWDNTNNRLGIGTSTVSYALHINTDGISQASPTVALVTAGAGGSPQLRLQNGTATWTQRINASTGRYEIYNVGVGVTAVTVTTTAPANSIYADNLGVGIGTNFVSNKLSIYDSSQDQIYIRGTSTNRAGIRIDNTAGQQSQILLADGGSDKWQLGKQLDNTFFLYDGVAGVNILRGISQGSGRSDVSLVPGQHGRVGIGTVPTAGNGKLEIFATGSLEGIYHSDGPRWLRTMVGTVGNGAYNNIVSDNDYALIFSGSKATNTPCFVIAPWDNTSGSPPASGLKIDPSGNVGIGTTLATSRLTVLGGTNTNIRIGEVYNNYAGITLNGSTAINDYNFISAATDTNLYINRPANREIYFRVANNTQMVLDSTGSLGIGGFSGVGTSGLDVYGKTQFRNDVGLVAGRTLYFGAEELFGGGDTGGSDYGYITFKNDDNDYNFWGDTGENSSFILGNQNDSLGNSVADVMVLKGAQANIFDSLSGLNLFVSANSAGRDPKVGIGTTSPSKRLVVHGSDALINDVTVGRGGVASNVGVSNTALGNGAGFSLNVGYSNNTALGASALYTNAVGERNTAVGNSALSNYNPASLSGDSTAVGYSSLYNSSTGISNTAVGSYSLYSATTAQQNVAIGRDAMYNGNQMDASVAIGVESMRRFGGSDYNVAIGYRSSYSIDKASYTTAVGALALYNMKDLDHATAVGYSALYSNTGSYNTAVGGGALYSNTSGDFNTAVGHVAGYSNTTAGGNVAVGYSALFSNTTASGSTAVGYLSQQLSTGADNTSVGWRSLQGSGTPTGFLNAAFGTHALAKYTSTWYSTAIGAFSLANLTSGLFNTAVGGGSGLSMTTGYSNSLLGTSAGSSTTTGFENVFSGISSGFSNTIGYQNVAVGSFSQANSTATLFNTSLGHRTLFSQTTGFSITIASSVYYYGLNTAVGYEAFVSCSSGYYNTGVGAGAGGKLTSGIYNTFVGPLAGSNLTTGNYNVVLGGYTASSPFNTQDNNIFISDGGGNLRMIITGSNGNVGIGTTNPGFKLDVNGTINGTNINKTYSLPDVGGSASWMKLGTFTAAQGGKHLYIKVVTSNGYNANPAQMSEVEIHFKTSNGSSTDANGFAGDATFYITNGSTSPGHNVKIKGNASGTSATAFEIWFYQGGAYNGTSLYTVEIPGDASGLSWSHAGTTGSDPGTASSTVHVASQRFVIQSSVGIGVTTPSTKLHVDGTIRNSNMPGTGLNYYIGINGNNDIVYIVSSRKYKKNIQNYAVGLDKIKLMNPVTYQEKLDVEQKTQVGLIAEELHDVGLTEYVFYNKNGDPDAVDYPRITAILTNGIKELKNENDSLKTEIQTLKDQISSILAMLSNK